MSRNDLLRELSSKGTSDEDMVKALLAGTDQVGPIKGETEALRTKFAKIILSKFKNPKPRKSKKELV